MVSPYFAENLIGIDFDPEDYIARLRRGTNERELKKHTLLVPTSTLSDLCFVYRLHRLLSEKSVQVEPCRTDLPGPGLERPMVCIAVGVAVNFHIRTGF
jgi:hypothetical protein